MVSRKMDSDEVVWLEKSNSYFVLSPIIKDLLCLIDQKKTYPEILHHLKQYSTVSNQNLKKVISDSYKLYNNHQKSNIPKKKSFKFIIPQKNISIRTYLFKSTTFTFFFETEFIESLIHPLFTHLEIFKSKTSNYQYHFFSHQDQFVFLRNNFLLFHFSFLYSHVFFVYLVAY